MSTTGTPESGAAQLSAMCELLGMEAVSVIPLPGTASASAATGADSAAEGTDGEAGEGQDGSKKGMEFLCHKPKAGSTFPSNANSLGPVGAAAALACEFMAKLAVTSATSLEETDQIDFAMGAAEEKGTMLTVLMDPGHLAKLVGPGGPLEINCDTNKLTPFAAELVRKSQVVKDLRSIEDGDAILVQMGEEEVVEGGVGIMKFTDTLGKPFVNFIRDLQAILKELEKDASAQSEKKIREITWYVQQLQKVVNSYMYVRHLSMVVCV